MSSLRTVIPEGKVAEGDMRIDLISAALVPECDRITACGAALRPLYRMR